ncbi:hypothetical protein [Crassaminicella profunda]|uniref:hypothetical protein n=1 Tax=Crassaminicella profunda TaxID=1286698 RepID=UPI001CA7764C|nr:hypothetical protein [Crassaminicella profunda]QZY54803.1 hypothetical protein K7H06_17530 [Crassaminicella profunda]
MRCSRKKFDIWTSFCSDLGRISYKKERNGFQKNRKVCHKKIIRNVNNTGNESLEEVYRLIKQLEEMMKEMDHISKVNIHAIQKVLEEISQTNESVEEIVPASQVLVAIVNQMDLLIGNVEREDVYHKDFTFIANEIKNIGEHATKTIVEESKHSQKSSKRIVKRIQRILALTMLQRRNIRDIEGKYNELLKVIISSKQSVKQIHESEKKIREDKNGCLYIDKKRWNVEKQIIENTQERIENEEQTRVIDEITYISENLAQLVNELQQVVLKFKI